MSQNMFVYSLSKNWNQVLLQLGFGMNLVTCFQDNNRKMYKEENVALCTTGVTWQLFGS